jgi:hypothetical protein
LRLTAFEIVYDSEIWFEIYKNGLVRFTKVFVQKFNMFASETGEIVCVLD